MRQSQLFPKIFSRQTVFEGFSGFFLNLSSGWFGILLVTPGLFGVTSEEYGKLLIANLPFGIIGLLVSFYLLERSKRS